MLADCKYAVECDIAICVCPCTNVLNINLVKFISQIYSVYKESLSSHLESALLYSSFTFTQIFKNLWHKACSQVKGEVHSISSHS